ncbi:MAG TPA: 3-deoxy-7-phosphoheptulonate synthase class II [Kofleriaceae bacterium]|nr:3-deoxy-7-phosphoheptulonate synthase class II [Kofleriaceae bacterium]
MSEWTPTSWQSKPVAQQPTYPDPQHLERVVGELSRLPPLVTSWEVEALKSELARAARGEVFMVQGGDCAESFEDCDSSAIASKLKILLQMSLVLVHGGKKGVVRVGRIAGQYAKPRSADTEARGDVTLPAYRGDIVNRSAFTPADRAPDPELLLRGYERAALTLNFIRALAEGGFADLHHPEYWDLSFVKDTTLAEEYRRIVDSLRESLEFMEALSGHRISETRRVDFYTSHEGLSLVYESAQTRRVPRRHGWYNLSTHMPWIGMRTATLEGGHVEYFRGIRNPIGIKVGPAMTPEWLRELIDALDPEGEPGRLVLIHRMGAANVKRSLPGIIETVVRMGRQVVWCADPMHGNTESLPSGIKTRRFENILSELEQAFEVHAGLGTVLGGVHFEMTGENVTECIGGASGIGEADLERAYRSRVDPRLNYEQALEMAMRIARHLRTAPRK